MSRVLAMSKRLKGGYIGDHIAEHYRVTKVDIRSVDCGSYGSPFGVPPLKQPQIRYLLGGSGGLNK